MSQKIGRYDGSDNYSLKIFSCSSSEKQS